MKDLTCYFELNTEITSQAELISALELATSKSETPVEVEHRPLTFHGDTFKSKDLVPLVIASAASITMIVLALSALIESLTRRPHFVTWDELEPIYDQSGKLLKDAQGDLIWTVRRRHELFEPRKTDSNRVLDIEAGVQGIVVRLESQTYQNDEGVDE